MPVQNLHAILKEDYKKVKNIRFGRDYYIKEASKAAGARKLTPNDEHEAVSLGMQTEPNENGCMYQAVPALVDPEGTQYSESNSLLPASPVASTLMEISSDSDLSIERIYNLNSGRVYETVGGIQKEIVRTVSPEGISFRPTKEFDKNQTIIDENHNSTTDKKRTFLKSLTEMEGSDDEIENDYYQDSAIDTDNTLSNSIIGNGNDSTYILEEHVVVNKLILENNNKYSIQEFSVEFSTDGENRTSAESSLNINSDPEIIDLKDKHLVKDKLGLFSKSYPQLAAVPLKKNAPPENGIKDHVINSAQPVEDTELLDTSVNDLKKKFNTTKANEAITIKQMHSLTARSISQTIRRELQEVNNESTHPINDNTAVKQEDIVEEPNYFPNAKNRIKFFENLNR